MTEQADSPEHETDGPDKVGLTWRVRLAIAGLILFAIGVVLFTNQWLTQRFTETTRSRAELRLALYSGNILTELQRNSVVPLLLASDWRPTATPATTAAPAQRPARPLGSNH